MARLADNRRDPVFLVLASFAAGQTKFLLGQPGKCRNELKRTAEFYSRERQRELKVAGYDCGIAAMVWDSLAAWMLGYPDQGLSRSAADQSASQENQIRRHGCPPPGPIWQIIGGIPLLQLLESLDSG